MDEKNSTIGLPDLLEEVSRDLDDYRRKLATDFGVKNVTLWWELEKERLLLRHAPTTAVRRTVRAQKLRRALGWFSAGMTALLAGQAALWLVFH